MILKLSFLLGFFYSNILAFSVLVSKQPINFEQKIEPSMFKILNTNKLKKRCKPLSLSSVQNNLYVTKHFINKGIIICQKDVKQYKNNSVIFNFGGFEIEKKGKKVYENEHFIRIKKDNGKFEKIYKDGTIK